MALGYGRWWILDLVHQELFGVAGDIDEVEEILDGEQGERSTTGSHADGTHLGAKEVS
jgi:hypothetical protein